MRSRSLLLSSPSVVIRFFVLAALVGIGLLFVTNNASAAACPVTDGGAGDGDASANGTIQVSSSTTWTMASGAAGDFWDCSSLDILVTSSAVLTLAGDTASGAYPYIKAIDIQIDSGASMSGNEKGCVAVGSGDGNGYGPSASNVCTQGATGYGQGSVTVANTRASGGGGHGGVGGTAAGAVAFNGVGGAEYGTTTASIFFGSSGGAVHNGTTTWFAGGTGGGTIRLNLTGTLTLNGAITANGGAGTGAVGGASTGGGSGGSIYIVADTLAGTTGSLSATGGAGYTGGATTSGGGGGGRVNVDVVTDSSSFFAALTSAVVTNGGSGPGSATDGATGVLYPAAPEACPVTDGGVGDGDGLANGTITISSNTTWTPTEDTAWNCSASTILVTNNATLTLASDTTMGIYSWVSAAAVTIDSGSTISSNSKGCTAAASGTYYGFAPNSSNVCTQGEAGAGVGSASSSQGAGGGGHGGPGGAGQTQAGGANVDTINAPVLFGASGGTADAAANLGGTGGGIIRIDVSGTFTHNGTVTATGGAGITAGTSGGGGGAGGSIYITSGTFAGSTGTFAVTGGAGATATYDGGGGGGGRVSVTCATCTYSLDAADFTLTGGSGPAEGTDGTSGSAYVKNTGSAAETIFGYFEVENTTYTFTEALTFDTAATPTCDSAAIAPVISADTITLGGTFTCTASTLTSLTLTATTGAVNMASGTALNVNVASAALNINMPAAASATWTSSAITGGAKGTFVIDDAVSINLAGTTSVASNVNWTNLVNVTVASGASINANSKGCIPGTYNGFAPNGSNVCTQSGTGSGIGTSVTSQGGGGGGHGGAGGAGSSGTRAGGGTYDSLTSPALFGASGGTILTASGGNGGGLISIQATGTVTVEGALSAVGGAGTVVSTYVGGAGAGGSIYLSVGTFAGTTGTFAVTGGTDADVSADGGGGGGGRVAVHYVTNSSSYLAGLTAAGVAAGGSVFGTATAGSTGTLYTAVADIIAATISSAVTADASGTAGKIDRIIITWSEDIDSASVAGADFTVVGYTVSSASRTASAQVTIVLTEGSYDTNAAPSTSVVGSISDLGGNATTSGTVVATDSVAPVAYALVYKDADANGQVDRFDVSFSEPVTVGECEAGDYTVGGVDAGALAISACTPSGSDVRFTVTGGPTNDTKLTITLAYAAANGVANSLKDAVALSVASISATSLTDGAAPLRLSQAYKDTNVNGEIDRLDVTFTEPVTVSLCEAGDYTIGGADAGSLAVSACAASGNDVRFTLTGGATDDTSLTLTFAYTAANGTANSLTDGTTPVGDLSATSVSDAAAPMVSSIRMEEAVSDGIIDRLIITWSENVDTDDGAAPVLADFGTIALPTGSTVSSATISDPAGVSNVITLTNVVGQLTINTGLGSLAVNGITTQWTDGTNVTSNPDDFETKIDGVTPFLRTDGTNAAKYQDSNADGTIDRVTLVFSETVTITYADGDWTATPNALTSFDVSAITSGNGTATILLTAAAEAKLTGVGAGTQPTLAFTPTTGSIVDASSNAIASISTTTLVDAATPRIRTDGTNAAKYQDSDSDGQVDKVALTFTEGVTVTYTDAHWTATANSLTGFDVGALFSGSGTANIVLTVSGASSNMTGVGAGTQPTLAFSNATAITDSASNALTSISTTSLVDDADPIRVSQGYRDVNANGQIDRFDITFSEVPVVTECEVADFTLGGADAGGLSLTADSCAVSGNDLQITVTGAPANVTSRTLTLTYTAANGTANSLKDTTGNTVANLSEASLSDITVPLRVSQSYKDTDNNGTVDRFDVTFTENIFVNECDAADYAITGADSAGISVSSCAVSGADLRITITGAASVDTNLTLSLAYTQAAGTANSLRDGNSNSLTDQSASSLSDAAAPVLATIQIEDTGTANGLIDKLVLTWSENLDTDDGSAPVLADFGTITLPDGTTVSSATISDPAGASNVVTLTSVVGQTTPNTAAGSTAVNGITSQWTDGTNVTSNPDDFESVTDAAAPFLRTDGSNAAKYQDNNGDGVIDRVRLVFSEAVTMTYADGDWSATPNALTSFDVSAITSGNGTTTVILTGSAAANLTGVGAETQPTLAFTATTGSIVDSSSNALASIAATSLADGAGALIVSTSPVHGATGVAGSADVVVVFTEAITIADATYSFNSAPSGLSEAWSVSDTTLTISHTGAFTSGASIIFTMTAAPDAAGNTLVGAISGVTHPATFTISAVVNPTISSSSTADADFDGYIDRVVLVISEDIIAGSVAGTDFTVDGYTVSSAARSAGARITIVVAESGTGDTAVTPLTTVVGSVTGVGAGEMTSGNTTPADAAAPALLSIKIEDTGTANGLIDKLTLTWSENLDTDDGAAPVLGDFGTITLPDGATVSSATISDPAGASAVVTLTSVVGQTTPNTAAGSTGINGITTHWTDGTNVTSNPDDFESVTDAAAPFLRTDGTNAAKYQDNDGNGAVDRVRLVFSEVVTISYTDTDWSATANNLTSFDVSGVTTNNASTIVLTGSAAANLTGVGVGTQPTLAFTNGTGSITDVASNVLTSIATTSLVDGAGALIVSTSPVHGATDVAGSADVVVVFTEAITTASATYGFNSAPSGLSDAWTVSDTTLTISHSGAFTSGASIIFTMTAAPDAAGNTLVGAVSGVTHPVTFTIAATIPTMSSSSTADNDSDGQIDRIVIVISEDIESGTVAGSDFSVVGYTVSSASRTASAQITIVLTESGAADTDATPVTSVVGSVTGVGGSAITSGETTPTDAAAPVRLSQSYKDTNLNGEVDRFDVTFSEPVAGCEASDWAIAGADAGSLAVSTCAASGDDFRLTVTGGATDDTKLTITLAYDATNGTANSLKDAANVAAASFTAVSLSDAAAPVLSTIQIEDTATANGLIDKLVLTWSENLDTDDGSAPVLADFGTITLPDGTTVSSATISDPAGASNVVTLTSVVGQTTPNTGAGSTAVNGITTQWTDGTNATSNPDDAESITDAAAPFLRTDGTNAAKYQDNNSDGAIDRVRLVFSEVVTMTYADGDWSATPNALTSFDVSAITSGNGSTTVILTGSAAANLTGVGAGTQPTLAFTATTGSIVDSSSNALAAISATSLADGAGALIVSVTPAHGATGVAGSADVVVVFTEAITTASATYGFNSAPSGLSEAWSVGDTTLTISHTGAFASGASIIFTMTAAPDAAANTLVGAVAGVTHPATFTIAVTVPSISSSSTADNDTDGQIDRIVLVISEDIETATVAGNDFSVVGYTVSSASRTASAQITIVLTESGAADTDATPAASVVGSVTGVAGGLMTSGETTPTDAAAPVRLSQTYKDIVSVDGRVDRVDVVFSEALTVAHCESGDYSFGGTDASGITVSSCTANGETIEWTISGAPVLDTNIDLTFGYTQTAGTANSLRDAVSNNLADLALTALTDAAAPKFRTDSGNGPKYLDQDGDGTIDGVRLTFTEPVTVAYTDSNWVVTANSLTGLDVTGVTTNNATTIVLTGTASASKTGVGLGTQPSFVFTAGDGGTLTDGASNALASIASTSMGDLAAPVQTEGSYKDVVAVDGTIDRLDITYTEPITIVGCEAGDYTLGGADAGSIAIASCATSGNDVRYTVTGATSNDTNLALTLAYTAANGTANSLTDIAGNIMTNQSGLTLADGAGALIISVTPVHGVTDVAVSADVVVVFTEAITTAGATYGFNSAPSGLSDVWSVGDTTLTISHTGGFTNGAAITFTMTAAPDAAGNTLAGSMAGVTHPTTFTIVFSIPVPVSSSTADADANGQIDRLILVISEDIETATVAGADFSVVGYTVASASRTASAQITIVLTESGAADTDATPAASVVGSVTGAGGGLMTSGETTPTDAAAPIRLSQTYKDIVSVDGRVDRVDTLFSEPMIVAECESGDYTFGGTDAAGIAVSACTANGETMEWTITGASAYDTNLDLTFGYTQAALTANSLGDAVGNNLADLSLAALSDAAVPFLRTDGSNAARYQDVNSDGTIDRVRLVFTELVTVAYADSDWIVTANDLTSFDVSGVTTNNASTIMLTANAATNLTGVGAGNQPTLAFSASGGSISDGTNALASISAAPLVDEAAPMITSLLPSHGENIHRGDNVVVTFTEPIDPASALVSFAPSVSGVTLTWDAEGDAATVSHAEAFPSGNLVLTVVAAPDLAGNALYGAISGVTHPATFGVRSSSGGTVPQPVTPSFASFTLMSDDNEEVALTPGSRVTLRWTTVGAVPMTTVSYAADGETFLPITVATIFDYVVWNVPGSITGTVIFKLSCTDLVSTCATFTTDAYPVVSTGTDPEESGEDEDPVDSIIDARLIPLLGAYIKAPSFSTVYYVTGEGKRRPFVDAQTYFTWAESFAEIMGVEDAILALMPIDGVVLAKPGTVLVKIQSDPKVYAIGTDDGDYFSPVLHWIPDERTAISVYGTYWADYVIDVPPTFVRRFSYGQTAEASDDVALSTLLLRTTLERAIEVGTRE